MSTLKVTNIQSNGAGFNDVVSFQNSSGTQNGTLCRSWVNFNGTFATSPFTIANGGIRASFNVSSITDNGVGEYTVNFATAMPDANYALVSTSGTGGRILSAKDTGTYPPTTTTIRLRNTTGGGSDEDPSFAFVAIFR